jgi:hypothetical protein
MGKGTKIRNSGNNIEIQHIATPCGKKYSGSTRNVEMLVKTHSKVCTKCHNTDRAIGHIATRAAINRQSLVDDMIDDIRKQVQ